MSSEESVSEAETAEDGPDAASADAPEAVTGRTEGPAKRSRLVLGAAALALAALLVAALFGIQWWVASGDDNADLANSREEVVRVGTAAVKAYTELDYTKPDEFFQRQLDVSTVEMQNQVKSNEEAYRKAMAQAQTTVATTVQDIAVEELNDHEGKASFIAAVNTVVSKGDQHVPKPIRLEVQMTRVGEEWKLSSIDQVPVVGTGQ